MKANFCFAALMALLIQIAPAFAGEGSVHGIGAKSCASFVFTLKNLNRDMEVNHRETSKYLGWVNGFATGAGLAMDTGPLKGVSGDEKLAWLRRYCGEHPNESFSVAAASLLDAYIAESKR